MRILDIKRIYLANKTNHNFASVLEAISSNKIILTSAVIIKGQQIMY
jgi:hypothetical protein